MSSSLRSNTRSRAETSRAVKHYATLAGVAAAAAAGNAEAALYIETLNQTMASFSPVTLSVGQNGGPLLSGWAAAANPQFIFAQYGNNASMGPYRAQVSALAVTSGGVNARVMFAGDAGGAGRFTAGAASFNAAIVWGGPGSWQLISSTGGAWQNTQNTTGYIFFHFRDDNWSGESDSYYGWLEVSRNAQGVYTLDRWAYETVGGVAAAISAPVAIPGGTGLAALAFGAAGLRGRRRSRN